MNLLLFMWLCFSNKYRIQNKLSRTVGIFKVVLFKKQAFSDSSGFIRPPHQNSIWEKPRQKSNKSYKLKNCKKVNRLSSF